MGWVAESVAGWVVGEGRAAGLLVVSGAGGTRSSMRTGLVLGLDAVVLVVVAAVVVVERVAGPVAAWVVVGCGG